MLNTKKTQYFKYLHNIVRTKSEETSNRMLPNISNAMANT